MIDLLSYVPCLPAITVGVQHVDQPSRLRGVQRSFGCLPSPQPAGVQWPYYLSKPLRDEPASIVGAWVVTSSDVYDATSFWS